MPVRGQALELGDQIFVKKNNYFERLSRRDKILLPKKQAYHCAFAQRGIHFDVTSMEVHDLF